MTQFSDEDYAVRCDLAAGYRLGHHYRLTDLIATHIWAQVQGSGHRILINSLNSIALTREVKRIAPDYAN